MSGHVARNLIEVKRATLFLLVLLAGCSHPSAPRVVLYCAQDREFAELVLGDFAKATGLAVAPKFDTEAAKSVGLAAELALDAKRPRCDVHWNNEILGTIRLQRQGVYDRYESPSAEPYPAACKPADRNWTAFAARARVLIVNTRLVPEAERPKRLADLVEPKWQGRVAMAKPQFGTTATQAAALFDVLGPENAKAFYRGLKANGVQVVAGNKHVAEAVARGTAAVGLTDTDDALAQLEAGKPVVIVYPDRYELGTLFIPNTLAVVKGCPNPAGARTLVDYLLSAGVEAKLAASAAHQIPMNPQVSTTLPPGLETPATVKPMAVNWERAADRWEASQQFLADEFAR